MAKIIVYGASDDLIEIEGDINEEFCRVNAPVSVAISDGTLLEIDYNSEWTIRAEAIGKGTRLAKTSPKGDEYTDTAHIETQDPIMWVMCGEYRRF